MKSYSTLRGLFGSLANNSSTTNLTLGDQLINDAYRSICASQDWDFLQKTATASTVASTQFYDLPFDCDKVMDVKITNGTTVYSPEEVGSRDLWDRINSTTSVTAVEPIYWFVFNNQLGFYPAPSSAITNGITFTYRQRVADLNVADYSTGTVDAVTNGSTTVTGSGTTWTSPMAGRWIRITKSNTAASAGDHMWYQISSVTNSTTLVLARAYNGTTLSAGAGAAYLIGQMPIFPEAFQTLPVYRALKIYFTSIQPEANQAAMYDRLYDVDLEKMKDDYGSRTLSPVLTPSMGGRDIVNPNLTISL